MRKGKAVDRVVIVRRKPRRVAVLRWRGDNLEEAQAFCKRYRASAEIDMYDYGDARVLEVTDSRWRRVQVHKGEWIAAEPDGMDFVFFPIEDDVLREDYEIDAGVMENWL